MALQLEPPMPDGGSNGVFVARFIEIEWPLESIIDVQQIFTEQAGDGFSVVHRVVDRIVNQPVHLSLFYGQRRSPLKWTALRFALSRLHVRQQLPEGIQSGQENG